MALGFMKHYASTVSDHSPENSKVLLPLGVSVKEIYEDYTQCYEKELQIELGHFYAIWRKHMSHVGQQEVDLK